MIDALNDICRNSFTHSELGSDLSIQPFGNTMGWHNLHAALLEDKLTLECRISTFPDLRRPQEFQLMEPLIHLVFFMIPQWRSHPSLSNKSSRNASPLRSQLLLKVEVSQPFAPVEWPIPRGLFLPPESHGKHPFHAEEPQRKRALFFVPAGE